MKTRTACRKTLREKNDKKETFKLKRENWKPYISSLQNWWIIEPPSKLMILWGKAEVIDLSSEFGGCKHNRKNSVALRIDHGFKPFSSAFLDA